MTYERFQYYIFGLFSVSSEASRYVSGRCACEQDLANWHSSRIVGVQRREGNVLMGCTPHLRDKHTVFKHHFNGSWRINSIRISDFKWFGKSFTLAFHPVSSGLGISFFLKTWLFTEKLNTCHTLPLSISQEERGLWSYSLHLLMWITFQKVSAEWGFSTSSRESW